MIGSSRSRALPGLVAVFSLALSGLSIVAATPARATAAPAKATAPPPKTVGRFTATAVSPTARADGQKAPSARIATSDPAVLKATGSKLVPVVVKFDYDGVAAYRGGIRGVPATSPSATGEALDATTATRSAYAQRVSAREGQVLSGIAKAVPQAKAGTRLRIVYGGVAMRVPAGRAKDLLKVPGVVAVQADGLEKPLTDASTGFIGAPSIWSQEGGQATAGNGILFGDLDTGAWPEHPSFADDGHTPAAPTDNEGNPLTCDFGDNPLTPTPDVFACNDKLVGGHAFLDTYEEVNPDSPETYTTARDSDGHGTHTASTAAGDITEADLLGVDRGQISGVAPGAWLASYKVCGALGCYESDSAAATQQAILDGVDVINFSIGGGTSPSNDPAELAFLDAYAAGVFVSASAGNDGPDASTAEHLSPWVTTVAASTQTRAFASTVTLTSTDSATYSVEGASVTAGVEAGTPVVRAEDVAGNTDKFCGSPLTAGSATGKIVVCVRGNDIARIEKGYNVKQGDAAGMILVNPTLMDVETDNHWLPAVHVADGTDLLAFLAAHPGITAGFTPGVKQDGKGDVLASFSSRGPGGLGIKPDITAPGVQILAGNTPTPDAVDLGPAGEYFQAIAGTSMSSPHIAGSALLLKALHPDWTPGEVKSAIMTSAQQGVVKDDEVTPADPFDVGSGRVALNRAGDPGLLLDETAERFDELSGDPVAAIDLNLPSIDAPTMPGRTVTTRTFTNTGGAATYTAAVTQPDHGSITVDPATFTIPAGGTQTVTVTIESDDDSGTQEFGAITYQATDRPDVRLPVAFVGTPGEVQITSDDCTPGSIPAFTDSTCSFTVDNLGTTDTSVDLAAHGDDVASVTDADQAADVTDGTATAVGVDLAGGDLGVPSVAPGEVPGGYLDLADFDIAPEPIGDEDMVNFGADAFLYNGRTYDSIGVDSNGYVVAGGGTGQDNNPTPQDLPDTAVPNDVLAPFWTDLDGTDADGVRVATLSDDESGDSWTVVQWDVYLFGTTTPETFQLWIGSNGVQDVSFTYDPEHLPTAVEGADAVVGAENADGTGGASLGMNVLPTEDLVVSSTDPTPGDSITWNVTAHGDTTGDSVIHAEVSSPILPGVDEADADLQVLPLPDPTVWTDPQDLKAYAGTTAAFTASAQGARNVRWEVSTDDGASFDPVDGADTPTLSFTAERAMDGNRYRAVFDNGTGGEVITDDATLTVRLAGTKGLVTRLYEEVLGREPDSGGLTYWTKVFDTTTAPTDAVAQIFAQQPEARRHYVDFVYLSVFGRKADPSGKAYWSNKLAHGMALDDLLATIRTSDAGVQKAGETPTDLARTAFLLWFGQRDANGENYWGNQFASNSSEKRRAVALRGFARTARAAGVAAKRVKRNDCGFTAAAPSTVLARLSSTYTSSHGDLPRLTAQGVALLCPVEAD